MYTKSEREPEYSNWKLQFYTWGVKLNEQKWIPRFLNTSRKTNKLQKTLLPTLYPQLDFTLIKAALLMQANRLLSSGFTLCLRQTNSQKLAAECEAKVLKHATYLRQGNFAVGTIFLVNRSIKLLIWVERTSTHLCTSHESHAWNDNFTYRNELPIYFCAKHHGWTFQSSLCNNHSWG